MAKRGADFQLTKDNDVGPGMASDGGNIQPQRATAAQMAGRKLATGKRSRLGSVGLSSQGGGGGGGGGGGNAPELQSTFNFGAAPQPNGWSGAFGTTSTSFSSGGSSSSTVSEAPSKSMFGGAGSSFGTGSTSLAPQVKFDFASSGNPFSFGSSSSFGASNNNNAQNSTTNKTPLFNFGGNDNTNNNSVNSHVKSPPATTTPPTSTSAQASPTPFFPTTTNTNGQSVTSIAPPSSIADMPKNPFASSFAPPSSNSAPSFGGFSAKLEQKKDSAHTFTSDEIKGVRKFLQEIGQKYQSADAFKVDVKAKIEGLVRDGKAGNLLSDTSVDQQVDKFVNELQDLQPRLVDAATNPSIDIPQASHQILLAMVPQLSPNPPQSNLFAAKAQHPFPTSSGSQPSTPSFSLPPGSFQSKSNPLAPSEASNQPPLPQPNSQVEPAELRTKIVKAVIEQTQKAYCSEEFLKRLRSALDGVLTLTLPGMNLARFPIGMTEEKLQNLIVGAVEDAYQTMDKAMIKPENQIQKAVEESLPKISSTLQTSIANAMKQGGAPPSQRPVEPMVELNRLKQECEQTYPPSLVPSSSVQISDMNEPQKQQATCVYRMRLFNRMIQQLVATQWLQPLEEYELQREYDATIMGWMKAHGVKRKAPPAPDELAHGNKRQNINGLASGTVAAAAPLLGPTTGDKRSAEADETTSPAKRARDGSTNPIGSPSASQTSQLFASIAGSPSKPSLFSSTISGQSLQPNNSIPFSSAPNTAAAAPSTTFGSASSVFTNSASTQPEKAAINNFAPKPATAGLFAPEAAFVPPNKTPEKRATGTPPTGFKPTGGVISGNGLFSQFDKQAKDSAAKEREKRKLEDFDSEEETEEEWEKRDAAEQAAKRQKIQEATENATGFIFKPSRIGNGSDAGKGHEADNEESDETGSSDEDGEGDEFVNGGGENAQEGEHEEEGEAAEEEEHSQQTTPPSGRSLFDRISRDEATVPSKPETSPAGDKTWKPDTPIKFGDASTSTTFSQAAAAPSASTSIFGMKTASESAAGHNPFGSSGTPKALEAAKNPFGSFATPSGPPRAANPFFTATSPTAAKGGAQNGAPVEQPTFNFISASPHKDDSNKSANLFGNANSTGGEKGKGLFGFNSGFDGAQSKSFENPFAKLAKPGSLQSITDAQSNSLTPGSVFASVGTSRATSPGMTTGDESTGSAGPEDTTPDPQLDLSSARAGEENENVLFEVRAKGCELVKGGERGDASGSEWIVRGVGELRLLKNKATGKCRILLRAGPASRVALNTSLMPSTSYTHPTPKSIAFVASMAGNISKWTIQVGKEEDADTLYKLLEEHKADGVSGGS